MVKGKTRKYLCGVGEPTRKEPVFYESELRAKSALARMYLLKSDYANTLYKDAMPKLVTFDMDTK